MPTIEVLRRCCEKPDRVRNRGVSKSGQHGYRCGRCQRTFQLDYTQRAYKPGIKEQIMDIAMSARAFRARRGF